MSSTCSSQACSVRPCSCPAGHQVNLPVDSRLRDPHPQLVHRAPRGKSLFQLRQRTWPLLHPALPLTFIAALHSRLQWQQKILSSTRQFMQICRRNTRKPNTSGAPSSPPLVEAATGLALFNLDATGDKHHVVPASALAASAAAAVGFIGLDVLSVVTANPILVGAHHAGPQFVKNLESRLVTRQSELPLELGGRHSGLLAGNQVGCPEPHGERRVGTFHDRARSDARVAVAMTAPTNAEAIGQAIGLSGCAAVASNEPGSPSGALNVGRAGRFVREQLLKLRQRARIPIGKWECDNPVRIS